MHPLVEFADIYWLSITFLPYSESLPLFIVLKHLTFTSNIPHAPFMHPQLRSFVFHYLFHVSLERYIRDRVSTNVAQACASHHYTRIKTECSRFPPKLSS